jgi:hypothetical protein
MRALYVPFVVLFLVACGSSDNSGVPDAGSDAVVQPDINVVETSVSYPAFTIDAPQSANQGGAVLTSPKVQPVFFPGFDYATELTDFTSKVGASMYWSGLSEYKVGAIVSATPITLTSAQIVPADIGNITDAYIQAWLQARFDGTHPEFGTTPDPSTIYTLYYPTATVISLATISMTSDGGVSAGELSCQSFGGYHDNVTINNVTVAYAVIPECPMFGDLVGVNVITATSSHELAEASSDPFPSSTPAYSQVDENHFAWQSFLGGGEIGDLCAQFPTSFYVPTDLGYMVQRTWSNARATAGADPCQPSDGTPYFNSMPVFNDTVAIRGGGMSPGIVVPVSSSKPLTIDLFSDSATSGPWTLTAQVYGRGGAAAPITLAFDNATGSNGTQVNLTVTSTGALTSTTKTATLVVTSTLGTRQNIWIGYVGQ